jgi:hypothetical protein
MLDEGLVFENAEYSAGQNLALKQGKKISFDPLQKLKVSLPAYCINKSKQNPSGEQFNLTPFYSKSARGAEGNNNAVWDDLLVNYDLS